MPAPPQSKGLSSLDQIKPDSKGPFNANEGIKSNYNAVDQFEIKDKDAKSMRDIGFGTVLTFMPDGIARGTSALVTLAETNPNEVVINGKAAAHYSFDRGSSTQVYPISLMGSNSLLRQTHYDADWYASQNSTQFHDETLEAYLNAAGLPQIFSESSVLGVLRADALGDELGKQYIIKGSGEEYQRLAEIKATNAPMIIPIDFPEAPKVTDPFEALDVSLEKMKHWELAPNNLSFLEKNGISFSISTTDLKDKSTFLPNLKKAIKNGLSEEAALKALTETPAKLIKVEDKIGQLNPGMLANFIICTNGIFTDSTTINENWVQGHRYIVKKIEDDDYAGKYELNMADTVYQLEVSGKVGKQEWNIVKNDSVKIKTKATVDEEMVTLSFSPDTTESTIRLSGWVKEKGFSGSAQLVDGRWVNWSANYVGALDEKKKPDEKKTEKEETEKDDKPGTLIYPFVAYGRLAIPEPETILIKNTTVWTNEADGILENTDVLIKDGKISKIGQDLKNAKAKVIDGTGKHLTSGIVDEHSHIAMSSINEGAINSSMVRMKDVLRPDDINIYRQLAGGVTTSQLLHGSLNPIGGQSAIVKLRWGKSAPELLVDGADKYIKFALGENPTLAWTPSASRYPRTRMGVEQVYVDCFTRAKEYEAKWRTYNNLSASEKQNTPPPRKELDMEPLVEILNGDRFITCHSYVQSEINMLMKVADQFGFKVNTFTHVLEGYKVADKMKAHGVGASTFSDWYNYKMEVVDAIPYNAAILNTQEVVTAINSDDAEMARRLNQEAAKTIKYGDVSEEDALKMVTLNPAKLLHLDDRIGSIKVGKDADVVLWNHHPLSIYSKPEKTIIDGTIYYDIEEDLKMQQWIASERARLIQKIKSSGENGDAKATQGPSYYQNFHCDDFIIDNQ